jgi:hypothetical protein
MDRIAVLILALMVSMLLLEPIFVGSAQLIVRHVLEETVVTVILVVSPAMAYNYFYTLIQDVILAVPMASMATPQTISVLLVIRFVMDAHCQVPTVSNVRPINLD